MSTQPDLSAIALVCTLTPSPGESSSQIMAAEILSGWARKVFQ